MTHGTMKGRLRGTRVNFDPETYALILERAEKAGHSFGEEVRLLVEWGLESVNEARAATGGTG